jgi:hypothetical protein
MPGFLSASQCEFKLIGKYGAGGNMIRFFHLFNYAEDIAEKDGENWYLGEHVPQVKKLSGVVRYRSWKYVDVGLSFPSWAFPTPLNQYIRRTELCFEDNKTGIQAVMENPQLWLPSQKGAPGFKDFECMFLDEEPEFNLLRDVPHQHYKYITLPLLWPKGRPQVDENEEIFIDSYCLRYAPGVSWAEGEDWYLGHHTREGKQLPGMRHYKTWRTIHVPERTDLPLEPNKWARLTELGMSPNAFKVTQINDDTRIRFTPPVTRPTGVIEWSRGGWLNISIKLDQYDDFLSQRL